MRKRLIGLDWIMRVLEFEAKRLGWSNATALINEDAYDSERDALLTFKHVLIDWMDELERFDELKKSLKDSLEACEDSAVGIHDGVV